MKIKKIALLLLVSLIFIGTAFALAGPGERCERPADCESRICYYHKCFAAPGTNCSDDASICSGSYTNVMKCVDGECCGRHAYPCENDVDDPDRYSDVCCEGFHCHIDTGFGYNFCEGDHVAECGDERINQESEECDTLDTCQDNSCSKTYSDYCYNHNLVEYDSDKKKDSTTITDSCSNTCLGDCTCQDCETDCSAPSKSSYCVADVCGATCAVNADCNDGNPNTLDTCNLNTCSCEHETQPYCGDGNVGAGETCEPPFSMIGWNNNFFCTQTTEECLGNKLGTRDSKGNCNSLCGCTYDTFNYQCVEGECGAQCDSNGDCEDNSCSETYNDACVGKKLKDYNGDKIENSKTVTDSCDNTCENDCTCTDCNTDCSATPQTYCVNDVCGAGCDSNDDCTEGQTCNLQTCGCEGSYCGDGNIDTGEECDDGNNVNGDGCSSDCKKPDTCNAVCTAAIGCDGSYTCSSNHCRNPSCTSETDCTCATPTCGDGNVDAGETCEPPFPMAGYVNNPYCTQSTSDCSGNKLGTRDSKGNCGSGCACDYDDFSYQCIKNYCGATCAVDADCDDSNVHTTDTCNLNTCGCEYETQPYCGDGIINLLDQCESPNTFDNPYCTQSTTDCQNNKLGTRDSKGNCDAVCGCTYDLFNYQCVLGQCGATCDSNDDCSPNACATTYLDSCSGTKLVDYNNNNILDPHNVTNTCDNTCESDCGCTDCTPDCSATPTTHCVKGVCGAACAVDLDCDDQDDTTIDTCNLNSCGCENNKTFCHDVAIDGTYTVNGINVNGYSADPAYLVIGNTYEIKSKGTNEGDFNETVHFEIAIIDPTTATIQSWTHDYSLAIAQSKYIPSSGWKSWDTTGLSAGNYTIIANASITPTECDYTDNEKQRIVILAECIDNDNCNHLDNDYCTGDNITHDEGICVNLACTVQTTNIKDCNDGLYCNGTETCSAAACVPGTPIDCDDGLWCTINDRCDEPTDSCLYDNKDCSGNNITSIEMCLYDPDAIPYTWDFRTEFTSVCDEANDLCTEGNENITHECDVAQCGAECEQDADCNNNTCISTFNDYCNSTKLVEYNINSILDNTTVTNSCTNTCEGNCSCTNCQPTCDTPPINTLCVPGLCGAECNDNNNITNDQCTNECMWTYCGDNIIQAPNGYNQTEECDDANTNNTDSCLTNCTLPTCGDGYIWVGHEDCDDGNNIPNDGCENDCTLTPTCPEQARVKIDFDKVHNYNITDISGKTFARTYVGPDKIIYGDNTYIDLVNNTDKFILDESLVEDVNGLALERGQGWIRIVLHGNNSGNGNVEVVDASVIFENAFITGFNDDSTNSNALENQGDGIYSNYTTPDSDQDEVFPNNNTNKADAYIRAAIDDDGFILYYECGELCGNNVIDAGEECDDGNSIDDDDCSNDCKDVYECNDKKDNDCDGLIDYPDDPFCLSPEDDQELGNTQCDDCIDNDDDGLMDFNDPGCKTTIFDNSEYNSISYDCADGVDNDGDGNIDRNDPGCYTAGKYVARDSNEKDRYAECRDYFDNDGDGLVDLADPDCDDKYDTTE